MYTALVMLHLLGASVWIGGHAALVSAVLPRAVREGQPARILEFERGFGRVGLAALAVQVVTGVWLAGLRIGDWEEAVREPSPVVVGVAIKMGLLVATVVMAAHAHHSLLPRLDAAGGGGLRRFAVHAWVVSGMAVALLVVGAMIRPGVDV